MTKLQSDGPLLSAVFVDYDNIYLSLKRKSEEAAKRFAKDAGAWLKEIETGRLITPTNGPASGEKRRIVMNRCYGNPVPRRNNHDNATDMNSFPFVRHHFLRAGFEVIDCPPLAQQFKNSADIRMVMDVLDTLTHETRFNEFIILSGDSDFTPVLHRLRTHARRTIVFANEHTVTPYTAISDGEIRETDLMALLVEGRLPGQAESDMTALPGNARNEAVRRQILAEVTATVRAAGQPLALEALADRAVQALGHDKTVGSSWGGAGSFRDLLMNGLPIELRLSEQPPYIVFEAARRQIEAEPASGETRSGRIASKRLNDSQATSENASDAHRQPTPAFHAPAPLTAAPERAPPVRPGARHAVQTGDAPTSASPRAGPPGRANESAAAIQQSIARIHEACKAPPLSPPDYRLLFNMLAQEINAHGLNGAQTLASVLKRSQEEGAEFRRDDVRFVLEVVSEADPWFEQGASANLFAGRFRNFVVARCRGQGLNLSADELDLIEAWFAGPVAPQRRPASTGPARGTAPAQDLISQNDPAPDARPERWWTIEEGRQSASGPAGMNRFSGDADGGEEFPRIVRSRIKG